ncbi:MAG TPA: hypothetical protein PKE27_08300 [Povalibacter sp.]|uniref:hypothetical protein n=1 Tax=Povalibacter sp. TaxID=1962978 RepID=UPI002C5932F2|nr:hypothetical protein [Povalibacter sp.]HMN44558.1 hypothetical protein [Povalibacter sp.]
MTSIARLLTVLIAMLLHACALVTDLSGQSVQARMKMHAGHAWRMEKGPYEPITAIREFREDYVDEKDLILTSGQLRSGLLNMSLFILNEKLVCRDGELPPQICGSYPGEVRLHADIPEATEKCMIFAATHFPVAQWIGSSKFTTKDKTEHDICVAITLVVNSSEKNDVDHDRLLADVYMVEGGGAGPGSVPGGPRPTSFRPIQESSAVRSDVPSR